MMAIVARTAGAVTFTVEGDDLIDWHGLGDMPDMAGDITGTGSFHINGAWAEFWAYWLARSPWNSTSPLAYR